MPKTVNAKSTADGLELGDLVLVYSKTPMYGKVIKIVRRYAVENDYQVKWKRAKVGEEMAPAITVERVLNIDLTPPSRKSRTTLWYGEFKKVDRQFILKMFKKVNDTLAYIKMLKERENL